MEKKVKPDLSTSSKQPQARRRYEAPNRRAAAEQTRRYILEAAPRLFLERAVMATTIAAIAQAAGVSHETVYAAFGSKPALFRYLIEIALSGTEAPVPALERASTRDMQAEPDPSRRLEMFAHVIRLIQERLAPVFDVLREGARTEQDLKACLEEVSERHVGHMRAFAAHLAEVGGLRDDLSFELAGDVIWIMTSVEFFLLCVRDRRWTADFFEQWLADALKRLLLPREV
jgi:AcrR family transcriptional regulator